MDRDEVEVHKYAKRTRPISSHLDRISLVNKGFIIWPKHYANRISLLRDQRGQSRSGSQSEHRIRFILPARGASHIIRVVIKGPCSPKGLCTLVLLFWPSLFVERCVLIGCYIPKDNFQLREISAMHSG